MDAEFTQFTETTPSCSPFSSISLTSLSRISSLIINSLMARYLQKYEWTHKKTNPLLDPLYRNAHLLFHRIDTQYFERNSHMNHCHVRISML